MYKIFGFIFLVIVNSPLAIAGQQLVNGDIEANDQMNKMLKIPGVQEIYDGCKKTAPKTVSDCVWGGVQGKPDIKKLVMDAAKAPATPTENTGGTIKENFSTDPALQKLGEVIGAKLREALYGPDDPKDAYSVNSKFQAVDQKRFSEIYKAELGKTMLDAFMSYCLDTVNDAGTNIQATDADSAKIEFEARRKKNIEDLKTHPITTLENGKGGEKWGKCLASVKSDCINEGIVKLNRPQQDRACLVTQYVEASKKNLQILKDTDSFYTSLGGGQSNRLPTAKADAVLVTTTSKDIDTAYKDADEKAKKDMEECLKTQDETKCKEFLNVKQKENEAGSVDFALQQQADKANFIEKADAVKNEDDLKKFLKERGYKDEEIKRMNLTDWKAVRDNIKTRYANEKEALIKEMNDRVDKKTASAEDKVDSAAAGDQAKLTKIQDELKTRSQDMQNLVMFTNVVSGFLEGTLVDETGKPIEKAKGSSTGPDRSTAALSAELSGNDKNQDLKKKIEEGGTKVADPNASGSSQDNTQGTVDASQFVNP